MTVTTINDRAGYTGDGTSVAFPFPYYFLASTDVTVFLNSVEQAGGFTVTGAGNPQGGTVNFTTAPGAGVAILLVRDPDLLQGTHLPPNDPFPSDAVEKALDKLTMIAQGISANEGRAVHFPLSETVDGELPLAGNRASKVYGFDVNGNPTLMPLPSSLGAGDLRWENGSDGTRGFKTGVDFTPNVTAQITLSRSPINEANCWVYWDGVEQTDFTITGGNHVNFPTAIPSGISVVNVRVGTTLSLNLPAQGSVTNDSLAPGAVTDAKVSDVQAVKLKYQLPGAGTVLRDMYGKLQEGVSLFDFIPLNLQSSVLDGSITGHDLAPYVQAARDWLAAKTVVPQLLAPPGVYPYSVSPNWAIQNASIIALGECRLRYTGTGNAVIIDVGPTLNVDKYNLTMDGFIVEAPSTAGHGVYVRSIHHSKLRFKVEGAGAASAAINVEFAVATDFSGCTSTPNERGAWYLGAMPQIGLRLAKRNAGEQVSYSLFENCVFEGLTNAIGAGIQLEGTLGNMFVGGTAEGCANGIVTTTESVQNRFFGTDLEVNSTRDILDQGQGNEFRGVDSTGLVTVATAAIYSLFQGGNYQNIELPTGVRLPSFTDVGVNRSGGGGFIIGDALDVCTAKFSGCKDIQFQTIVPARQKVMTVPAGPNTYQYKNNTPNLQQILMSGGTVTSTTINRNGTDNGLGITAGLFPMKPGDTFKMAFSAGTPSVVLMDM